MHRANASVLLLIGLLSACASGAGRSGVALGWSLGGEAHVFIANDDFARDYYRWLTGSTHLSDTLARRSLVSVQATARRRHTAQVFWANGLTPGTTTLTRFHAPGRCGFDGIVTEIVLAFPTVAGNAGIPPARETIVAALDQHETMSGGAGPVNPSLSRREALELVNRVVRRAEEKAPLLRPLQLDPDQASDAGEVVPLGSSYGVGFRARVLAPNGDTVLVTGVASTDRELHHFRWVAKPRRLRLTNGMTQRGSRGVRYSLRGFVAPTGFWVLVDEFADASLRDSRATVVSVESGRVIAAQPLALRCP